MDIRGIIIKIVGECSWPLNRFIRGRGILAAKPWGWNVNLNEPSCFTDELMAFVMTCLFCGAISRDELNLWCAKALSLNNAPAFLYDLMDFHDEIFKVYKVIGYVPHWEHTEDDEHALYGVAVRRGFEPYDMPLTSNEALACLEASPDIERLFGQVFDFIKL